MTRSQPPRSAAGGAPSRQGGPNRTILLVVGAVVVVGVALLVAIVAGSSADKPKKATTAAKSVIDQVRSVPAATFSKVGLGSGSLPVKTDAPALAADGKPRIVFIGAEYCPYCAAERWSVVVALSRFGTFSGLKQTHSSSLDVHPSTATFSFVDATYASDYVHFESVELQGNEPVNGQYPVLQKMNADQQRLFATYNSPPYVRSAGSIPFVDVGGPYLISGASYDAGALDGMSAQEIAGALHDPSTDVAKGVVGAANGITAAICVLTHGQPANVCSAAPVVDLQKQL